MSARGASERVGTEFRLLRHCSCCCRSVAVAVVALLLVVIIIIMIMIMRRKGKESRRGNTLQRARQGLQAVAVTQRIQMARERERRKLQPLMQILKSVMTAAAAAAASVVVACMLSTHLSLPLLPNDLTVDRRSETRRDETREREGEK